MKYISRDGARNLALKNKTIMKIFEGGYLSTMDISNPKLMNDVKVKPNSYLVNDDFEENPICFIAYYHNKIYKVLRCIYVSPNYRRQGLAKDMISHFKNDLINDQADFLQIGVECTNDDIFDGLNDLYLKMGFKSNPIPIPHSGNKKYLDYFWSSQKFEVHQEFQTVYVKHV